jgi:tRNA(adenine34) deaminase
MNNLTHKKWMKLALDEAIKAYEKKEIPVGAIVVKDGRVIGRGYNQRENLQNPTAHAEIIALTSAANTLESWRLKDCSLYVTKEPCPMCAGAIMNARISHIYFGMHDDVAGCCGSLYQLCRDPRFNHQSIVQGGIMEADCISIMKDFFNMQRENK